MKFTPYLTFNTPRLLALDGPGSATAASTVRSTPFFGHPSYPHCGAATRSAGVPTPPFEFPLHALTRLGSDVRRDPQLAPPEALEVDWNGPHEGAPGGREGGARSGSAFVSAARAVRPRQ